MRQRPQQTTPTKTKKPDPCSELKDEKVWDGKPTEPPLEKSKISTIISPVLFPEGIINPYVPSGSGHTGILFLSRGCDIKKTGSIYRLPSGLTDTVWVPEAIGWA